MFLNFGILKSFLVNFLQCPQCKENDVNLWNDSSKQWFFVTDSRISIHIKKSSWAWSFSAIIEFNDGCSGLNPVFELFGIGDGKFIKNSLTQCDIARIDAMEIKSHATGILRRKCLRAIKATLTRNRKQNPNQHVLKEIINFVSLFIYFIHILNFGTVFLKYDKFEY